MKNLFTLHIIIAFFLFGNQTIQAQEEVSAKDSLVIVVTENGEEFIGKMIAQSKDSLSLKLDVGIIKIATSRIKSIKKTSNTAFDNYANQYPDQYFLSATARPLAKNQAYYKNMAVILNYASVGVSDHVSLGGGFETISLIAGTPVFFLNTKAGTSLSERWHASGGLFFASRNFESEVLLAYSVFTYGSNSNHVSAIVGFGLQENQVMSAPPLAFSTSIRLSKSMSVMSENFLIPGFLSTAYEYAGIHGVKFRTNKNTFNIGGIVYPDFGAFVDVLPYAGYTRYF